MNKRRIQKKEDTNQIKRTSQITNHPSQKIENEKFLFFFLSLKISKRRLLPPNARYSITLGTKEKTRNQK